MKLSYTWYPKDWSNSESVFELSLCQKGLYRELIDLAMLNDNKTIVKISVWCRKWDVTENEINEILNVLSDLKLIKITNNNLFIQSCEPRLKLVRGGRNGGNKNKPTPKPTPKPTSKPISKPTPKQREREKKEKRNINLKEKIEGRKLKFSHTLKPFFDVYGKELLNDFYKYWTEPNKSNSKFRQELETTWSLEHRLGTWAKNDNNFNSKAQTKQKPDKDTRYD